MNIVTNNAAQPALLVQEGLGRWVHVGTIMAVVLSGYLSNPCKHLCVCVYVCVLFPGDALKCNYCFSKGGDLCTPTTTQTCPLTANACGAVILSYPLRKCEGSHLFIVY